MQVESVWRYPLKSMLGEQLGEAGVTARGIEGDRRFAVVDALTGTVASAKQPRLWRSLLAVTAVHVDGTVHVRLPGEPALSLDDPEAHARLSAFLRRPVRVSSTPALGADIDRADPEEVLVHGVEAVVSSPPLMLGLRCPTRRSWTTRRCT